MPDRDLGASKDAATAVELEDRGHGLETHVFGAEIAVSLDDPPFADALVEERSVSIEEGQLALGDRFDPLSIEAERGDPDRVVGRGIRSCVFHPRDLVASFAPPRLPRPQPVS
jgi:hypothetical protein